MPILGHGKGAKCFNIENNSGNSLYKNAGIKTSELLTLVPLHNWYKEQVLFVQDSITSDMGNWDLMKKVQRKLLHHAWLLSNTSYA